MKEFIEKLSSQNWGILDVLLSDASSIDLPRLAIYDRHDAQQFMRSYGFSLNNPEEAAAVEKIRRQALTFIDKIFLATLDSSYEALEIPEHIRNAGITELLLLASSPPDEYIQRWACALLRVMHTFAHAETDMSMHFFPSILDQILEPYYRHIRPDNGQMWLGSEAGFRLPLVDFQVKAGKDRDSTILKLLHKPENVAADLFDRIGVRFVTRDRLDALLVLHYLRERHLVAFPNVKPSHSRNTLLDILKFRKTFHELKNRYDTSEISLIDFETTLRQSAELSSPQPGGALRRLFNPHSSRQYRSIQFTVRQMVHLVNPLYSLMDQLELKLEDHPAATGPLLREPLAHAKANYRFFFPYEIQIVDQESHQSNIEGPSSHEAYKLRQLEAARKRVLGSLLKRSKTRQPSSKRAAEADQRLQNLAQKSLHSDDQTAVLNVSDDLDDQTQQNTRSKRKKALDNEVDELDKSAAAGD